MGAVASSAAWEENFAVKLIESLILSLTGGALGVALAWWGLRALLAAAPVDLPRLQEVRLDAQVLLFALAISLLAGLIFGVVEAHGYRLAYVASLGLSLAGTAILAATRSAPVAALDSAPA